MAKAKNTYIKGLNQDNSRSKYDQAGYYDALNIKVVTNKGLSTGSIETEKGTSLSFSVPDTLERVVTYTDGTTATIPAQQNLKITGWCCVHNYVVLFTCSQTTPGGVGQVWAFKYDEVNNTILDGVGSFLQESKHLVYNNALNFSNEKRIEAVGRYENEGLIRVYWTDNINSLRSINIMDKANNFKTKPDILDTSPNVTFSQPTVVSVQTGDLPVGGKVQYAYRLTSDEGSETVYSPASALVSLADSDARNEDNYVDIVGNGLNDKNSKSVTFKIQNIDRNYTKIEHIAILYTVKDATTIFKFAEETITSDDITVTLTGREKRLTITDVELAKTSSGFNICKTIDIKDNRLVVANLSTISAEITDAEWDARAYRFNSSRVARLYNANGTTLEHEIYGTAPDWTIPETADAVNIYNKEDINTRTGTLTNQYKFKADGTTLGGEGKNVSYTFIQEALDADGNRIGTARAPMYDVERTNITYDTGMTDPKGSPISVTYNNVFKNFSDPTVEALWTGYARGETYRFGIEFTLKKGNSTFVKWIGDIRIPEPADHSDYKVGDGSLTVSAIATCGPMSVYTIGIKFRVNIQDIADKIGGFRIVRVERPVSEMTKLGTGFLLVTDRQRQNENFLFGNIVNLHKLGREQASGTNIGNDVYGMDFLTVNGDTNADRFHLPDLPALNLGGYSAAGNSDMGVHYRYASTKDTVIFLSPLTLFKDTNEFEFKTGDYLKLNGYYRSQAYQTTSASSDNNRGQAWQWYSRTFFSPNHLASGVNYEAFKIKRVRYLEDGEHLINSSPFLTGSITSGGGDFLNVTYGVNANATSTSKGYPFGIGNNIYLMILESADSDYTLPRDLSWQKNSAGAYAPRGGRTTELNYTDELAATSPTPNGGNSLGQDQYQLQLTSTPEFGHVADPFFYKEMSWTRPISLQYGGNTYEVRSKQQYMSVGHFQPITDATNAITFNYEPKIWGGDTYVSYWSRQYIQMWFGTNDVASDLEQPTDPPFRHSVAAIMPVESYINTNLAYGVYYAKDFDSNDVADYTNEVYKHNRVYRQQNNSENKFFAKDFASSFVEIFPHRLWASDKKTDGEAVDSWRSFKPANVLDVEGTYGPINKIINFQDRIYFYQDRAVGIAAINERTAIRGNNATDIVLGPGDILSDFRYASTTTGTVHQFSVVASNSSLYHYDATIRKLYKMSPDGQQPISDLKGISSFFNNNVDGEIAETDITLRKETSTEGPVGVHSTFDHKNNRALFTFLSPKKDKENFTVSYNELMQSFESFYSFVPNLYLNTGRRIISADPASPNVGHVHNEGRYGEFHGVMHTSYVTLLVAPDADVPKIFTNIEYNSEVSLDDIQQPKETLTSLEIWNDYQTTGNIPLIVGTNVKRRMRHWRHAISRDSNSSNNKARIRDYSVFMKLSYANNSNKRMVLHDIIVTYTPARD